MRTAQYFAKLIGWTALIWLLASVPARAQSIEIGVLNTGALATEATHRMRPHSMPGALYLGASYGTRITFAISASFTTLTKTQCDGTCASTGRDYRPDRTEPTISEHDVLFVLPRVGIAHTVGPLTGNVGFVLPLLQGPYSLVGASPMLVKGAFAELQLRARAIAIVARYTSIPPQSARWVSLSEHTGYKQHGQDFPNGSNDPHWIGMIEAGFRIYARTDHH